MEYPWQSVIVAIFALLGAIVVVVLCARWGGWCSCSGRRRTTTNEKKSKPPGLPKSIQHAMTQLEGVTEKRTGRNPQTESEEAECPICLSYLYPKEIPAAATPTTNSEVDLEAGLSRTTTSTTDTVTHEKKRQSMQPVDDEVLKLKRCTHIFHARCLATWFLRKKYDCPVCRTPYYQVVPEVEEEDYRMQATLPVVAFW
ncbi:uncharacterized protein F4822DRAFT_191942 [Hypoxylon trugodes]|uniref:uncharacterized protein n=1 Tax=Hypoxylon trugodes TaxID=326681 RepID=UPI00218F3B24|nr:uncharacterized protein F4822DRAFT_191942 [Hypoxylon trugodes]KAI1391636.1 hypothetical protein F4822DRAFT_191942 [Hypoxylon trugodes]